METLPSTAHAPEIAGVGIPDAAVVLGIQSGRREDFAILVHRYMPNVRRLLACRHGIRGLELDETAHQAFVEAYMGLPKLREPARFAGYLFAIVRRIRAPRTKHQRQVKDLHASVARDDAWRETLGQAIGRLSEPLQEILSLKYCENLTAEQIGERLGLATGTVTKNLSRAYEQLRNDSELKTSITGD